MRRVCETGEVNPGSHNKPSAWGASLSSAAAGAPALFRGAAAFGLRRFLRRFVRGTPAAAPGIPILCQRSGPEGGERPLKTGERQNGSPESSTEWPIHREGGGLGRVDRVAPCARWGRLRFGRLAVVRGGGICAGECDYDYDYEQE
jgi:hypothetical protein